MNSLKVTSIKHVVAAVFAASVMSLGVPGYAADGDLIVDGKLGIGTSNPGAILDVNGGDIKLSAPSASLRDSNGEAYMSFGAATNEADNQFVLIGSLGAATGKKTGYFGIATNNKERVRVDVSGNVGIGTVNPTPYLSGTYGISLFHQKWPGITLANSSSRWLWYMTGNDLRLWEPDGGDRISVLKDGNVGIGTTNPTPYLFGTSGIAVFDPDYPGISLVNGSNKWLWYMAGNDLRLFTPDSGDRLTVLESGEVGIGTTSPGAKLHVVGDILANNFPQTSDLRFKKNLLPIHSPLNMLLNISGVTYEWKTDEYKDKGFPEGRHYGVIAQEIETVLPEVVNTSSDGTKAVAYTEIIPVLIEAIKEQQILIVRQRERIEKQQERIERLEERL